MSNRAHVTQIRQIPHGVGLSKHSRNDIEILTHTGILRRRLLFIKDFPIYFPRVCESSLFVTSAESLDISENAILNFSKSESRLSALDFTCIKYKHGASVILFKLILPLGWCRLLQ